MGQLVKLEADQLRHCVGQISNWQSNSNLMASNRKERMLSQETTRKSVTAEYSEMDFPEMCKKTNRAESANDWIGRLRFLLAGRCSLLSVLFVGWVVGRDTVAAEGACGTGRGCSALAARSTPGTGASGPGRSGRASGTAL